MFPNESNKPTQMINFWFGENVVHTIFKANTWRGVTANNFPVVMIFQKKTYKGQVIRATFSHNLPHNIVALQVEKRCCPYYHLCSQLVMQQISMLQVVATCCAKLT